jgi:hypothetical protein
MLEQSSLPTEVADILRINLKSRTSGERERAVRWLTKPEHRGHRSVLAALRAVSQDPDKFVRKEVAAALGALSLQGDSRSGPHAFYSSGSACQQPCIVFIHSIHSTAVAAPANGCACCQCRASQRERSTVPTLHISIPTYPHTTLTRSSTVCPPVAFSAIALLHSMCDDRDWTVRYSAMKSMILVECGPKRSADSTRNENWKPASKRILVRRFLCRRVSRRRVSNRGMVRCIAGRCDTGNFRHTA